MKILMPAPYDVTNPRSWSGTPLSLYSAMSKINGNEVTPLDLSSFQTQSDIRINTLKNLDFKSTFKNKALISKLGPASKNPLNSKYLKNYCNGKSFDAILQLGGFKKSDGMPPTFVYSDSSYDLKLDYYKQNGVLPFGSENDSIDTLKIASDYAKDIYTKADGVLCMSQWMANSIINTTGVKPENVYVVYAGANWHGVTLPQNITPKNIDGKKEIHLLLTGVSYLGKGVDIAVKAVDILNRDSDKKYYLHVCGITHEYEHSEFVINHGFVGKPDLIEILKNCDIFVLPTRFDCFGISYIEAMKFGLPCVGRNICAIPEIIDEGKNGELVESESPLELAEKISFIGNNDELYAKYSESAIKKAEYFTWESIAENITNIIGKKI